MRRAIASGPMLIVIAGVLWGLSGFTKKIMLGYIDPSVLTVINALCVSMALVTVWSKPKHLWTTFRRMPGQYLLLGFFGTTLGTTMLYIAIDHLSLSVASAVGKLQPVFVIALAYLFLKERLTKYEVIFSLIAIFGAFLVAIPDPLKMFETAHGTVIGFLAALASSIGWAISGVVGRGLSTIVDPPSPAQLTFFRYFIGSMILAPFVDYSSYAAGLSTWPYPVPFLLSVFVLSLLTVTLPVWIFYKGLKTVSASYASVLELSTPLTGIFLGTLVLGDRLNASQILGVVLVIAPIVALELYRLNKAPA